MRNAPIARRRVTKEAALDVVVRSALRHAAHRAGTHVVEMLVAGRAPLAKEELERFSLRKLWFAAETTELRVVTAFEIFAQAYDRCVVQRLAQCALGIVRNVRQHRDFMLALDEETCDLGQRSTHLWRWKVRRAGERPSLGREKGRRRPAAHIVARVDIGTAIVIDANGDEAFVNRRDDAGIGV